MEENGEGKPAVKVGVILLILACLVAGVSLAMAPAEISGPIYNGLGALVCIAATVRCAASAVLQKRRGKLVMMALSILLAIMFFLLLLAELSYLFG